MKLISIVFVVAALTPAVGSTQPGTNHSDRETISKDYFERGQKLIGEKKYLDALAAFSAGYELSRRPLFLFNMAESARFAGDVTRAKELFARYLQEDPNGKLAATARQRLAALGGTTQAARPTPTPTPANATPSSFTPPARRAEPAPTTRSEPVAASAIPTPRDAAASYEARQPVRDAYSPPAPPPLYKRPVFWVGVGAAAALVTTVAILATSGGSDCDGCTTFDFTE